MLLYRAVKFRLLSSLVGAFYRPLPPWLLVANSNWLGGDQQLAIAFTRASWRGFSPSFPLPPGSLLALVEPKPQPLPLLQPLLYLQPLAPDVPGVVTDEGALLEERAGGAGEGDALGGGRGAKQVPGVRTSNRFQIEYL